MVLIIVLNVVFFVCLFICLFCFLCILGMVMVNWIAGDNSTSSPLSPITGYGHFNVSNKDGKICLLLDLSCTVSVLVDNKVGLVVN